MLKKEGLALSTKKLERGIRMGTQAEGKGNSEWVGEGEIIGKKEESDEITQSVLPVEKNGMTGKIDLKCWRFWGRGSEGLKVKSQD